MPKLWIGDKMYSVESEVQDYCETLEKRIEELEALKDTVQINCSPPDDCNDPVVLKKYMKACFEEAMRL